MASEYHYLTNYMESLAQISPQPVNAFETLKSLLLLGAKEIYLSGLRGSSFAYLLAKLGLRIPRTFLVITSDNDAADELCQELRFYLGEEEINRPVLFFPAWETLPYDSCDPHPEKTNARLETLYHLQCDETFPIVVSPLRALMQQCIPPESLKRAVLDIHLLGEIDRDSLVRTLVEGGYQNVPLVEERGECSVRGGIVDVFPPLSVYPIRIELFGDKVESIRQFHPVTQRSISTLERFCILPVSEIILNESTQTHALKAIAERQKAGGIPSPLARDLKEKLSPARPFSGMAFLLEFFYDHLGTFFQYLPSDSLIWAYELSELQEKIADFFEAKNQSLASALAEGKVSSLGTQLYLTPDEIAGALEPLSKVWIEPLDILRPGKHTLHFSTSDNKDVYHHIMERKSQTRPLARLVQNLREWLNEYYSIHVVCHSETQKKRLHDLLESYGFFIQPQIHFSLFDSSVQKKETLTLLLGKINRGFRSRSDRLIILTEAEIFGEKYFRWEKPDIPEGYAISNLEDLHPNDFVVHVDYGIGQYQGLHSLEIGGSRNDYLLIEYLGGDRLYVPVYRLNLVQKYRGVEGERPVLHKLGGKTWLQTKKKVTEAIQAHAKELLKVYATRHALNGFSFSPHDQYYREFEARFEYEETRDQTNAIEDVLADMENPRPMDRLICGDVGYGKTEVVLRASFKAVMDNKQVAILVPTTILAHQHYQTFSHRFRDFPVTVAMLSRFRTPREQKEILQQLKEGKVDIVIGTHRLLQKDIGFKDLGLVILDEEHRFGVKHKERLKKMRMLVDVLALTATPIPRTLQLSLLEIRDLSIINTPPEDRLAVQTYITHFDGKIIREAIIREFMRNGQVFFVHNRVQNIEAMAQYLKELVPEARLGIAHGQMPEKELERAMWNFYQKDVNLLLCTTIIESGLDFPQANTIIVNRADKLGLAQLYQLRGRVGRSVHRAYAYFLIPRESSLTNEAKKRLQVMGELSDLGSGFRLANYDLEIRGGGNILGLSQSGHMAAVGIELYYQLIEKAVREIKGERLTPDVDPEIRLQIPAYIPEEYIPDIHQRLRIYKKMAGGIEDENVLDMKNELRDRFGPLPLQVENLLLITNVKPMLKKYLITTLDYNGKDIILTFHPEADKSLDKILALIQTQGKKVRLSPDYKLYISFQAADHPKEVIEKVKKILQE
ncbi:MAG: transcription-repair coupling factor [Pseudomonadota bacterium]